MARRKDTFAMIPNVVLRRTDISPAAKLTFARLLQYAGRDGKAFPLQETLAAEIGLNRRSIRRQIRELVAVGLIASDKRNRHESNAYRILDGWLSLDRTEMDGLNGLDRTKVAVEIGQKWPEVRYNLRDKEGDGKAPSPIRDLIKHFKELHLHHIGRQYIPDYGADGDQLKRVLAEISPEDLKGRMSRYFARRDKWNEAKGYTIKNLCSENVINGLGDNTDPTKAVNYL
jgi:predicted transcriptional regulator